MATGTMTAPAVDKKNWAIKDYLADAGFINQIAKALPKHCSADRMARVAITALTKTPKLAQCTQASFFECLLSLSQYGLEPDGRRAHLIPYGTTCTLIIDYKGYVELAYRSGMVQSIHADVVYTGDVFRYSCGDVIEHVPHFLRHDVSKPKDRGDVYAVYCRVQLKNGATKTEVMSNVDVEAIRKRSKAAKAGPWVTDWNEMAKKTVFRRCSKWLPLSAEIIDLMDRDDDRDDDRVITVDASPAATGPQTVDELTAMLSAKQETAGAIEGTREQSEAESTTNPLEGVADLLDVCSTVPDVNALEKRIAEHCVEDDLRILAELSQSRREAIRAEGPQDEAKGAKKQAALVNKGSASPD